MNPSVQAQLDAFNALSPAEREAVLDDQARAFAERSRTPHGPRHTATDFQERNLGWLQVVTRGDPTDLPERRARYGEESLELLQAAGMTRDEVIQLVDYVFSRPVGDPGQEIGGALTCLTGLCTYLGQDMMACGEAELARVWAPEMIEKIRRKRATRHGRGPLPGFSVVEQQEAAEDRQRRGGLR